VVWARLQDRVTGGVVFAVSHHGPLPVNTGGATGGATVAYRINQVISYNKGSADTVVLGGDFNAESGQATVTTLQGYGYNLRASNWVDHVFTKGSALDATPQITIVYDTGSDHRGIKATWSGGLGGSSTDTGSNCGYIPSTCSGDLSWAMSSGRYNYPGYYQYFYEWTGVSLTSASQDDMVAYWVCTGQNPNGNCDGLQLPCGWGSCPGSGFEIEDYYNADSDGDNDLFWMHIALGVAAVVLCMVMAVCLWRRKRAKVVVEDEDDVELRSDEQLQGVDDQMIELEESIERADAGDGDANTIEVTV